MFHIRKYSLQTPMFAHLNQPFTREDMEQVSFLEDLQKFESGTVGGAGTKDDNVRNSDISWLGLDRHSEWLFHKFADMTSHVNRDKFMLNIDGFEKFQYTVYNPDQHYSWHMDWEPWYNNFERKLSAVVMISDPSEYEGGELEVVIDGNIEKPLSIKMNQGDVVYFASWMPHRVKPVTSGKRKTLVAWVMGPRNV